MGDGRWAMGRGARKGRGRRQRRNPMFALARRGFATRSGPTYRTQALVVPLARVRRGAADEQVRAEELGVLFQAVVVNVPGRLGLRNVSLISRGPCPWALPLDGGRDGDVPC